MLYGPGGFIRRLREGEGTWMGHILEHVAIELQQLAGADVTFGKIEGVDPEGEYHVIYAFEEEGLGGGKARAQTSAQHHSRGHGADLPPREVLDFESEREDLIEFAQRWAHRRRHWSGGRSA